MNRIEGGPGLRPGAPAPRSDPREIEDLARMLRDPRRLDPEARKRLRAHIEKAYPPGSEGRLRLGEAIARLGGNDPRGISGKALEVSVAQALKAVERSVSAKAPQDVVERTPLDRQRLQEAFAKPPAPAAPAPVPAEHVTSLEEAATLAREALEPDEGSFGQRLAARLADPRLEKVAFHAGVARELLAKGETVAAREELAAIRSELGELPEGITYEEIEQQLLATEGELRLSEGRSSLEEELQKVGSGLDPSRAPAQQLWKEEMVNTVSDLGRKQGGLTPEQGEKNGELARSILPEQQEWGPGDLALVLKQSGLALEKLDPNQLVAAARYLNTATSLPDQQEKLRKTIDNFQALDRIGLPKLPREQMINQLWAVANVPGHALSKLSDKELHQKFEEVLASLNGGPGASQVKLGSHTLKLEVGENGEVLKSETKQPSLLSRIGRIVNIAAPFVLTALSFIPVTAPFARAAQAILSLVQAIRSRSVMGIASFAVSFYGFGKAALGRTGEAMARGAYSAFRAAQAIRQRNWGGLVGSVAGMVASGAAAAGEAAQRGAQSLAGLAERLGSAATQLQAASAGVGALQSYRGASRAVSEAKKALEQATASGDARAVTAARRQLQEAERGKRSSLLGAAEMAVGVAAQAKGSQTLAQVGQGLGVARAVHDKDYGSAAASALSFAGSVKGSANLTDAGRMAQAGVSYYQSQRAEAAAKRILDDAKAQLDAARRAGNPERIQRAEQALKQAERGFRDAARGTSAAMGDLQRVPDQIRAQRMDAALRAAVQGTSPLAARPSAGPVTALGVEVQAGDTIWAYSQLSGIPVERILAFNAEQGNALDPTRLRIGQSVLLPTGPGEVKFQPKTEAEVRALQRQAVLDKRLGEMAPPRIHSPELPMPPDLSDPRTRLLFSLRNDRAMIEDDLKSSRFSALNPTTWVDTKEEQARSSSRDAFKRAVDRLQSVLTDPRSSEAQVRAAVMDKQRALNAYHEARGIVERANEGGDVLTPVKELAQKGQDAVHGATRQVRAELEKRGLGALAAVGPLPLDEVANRVNVAAGVVKGAVNAAQGVAGMIAHPIETAKGLAELSIRYEQTTLKGQALAFLGEVAQGKYRTTEEALRALQQRANPLALVQARIDLATDVGKAVFAESIRLAREGKLHEAFGVLGGENLDVVLGTKGLGRLGRVGAAADHLADARKVLDVGRAADELASVNNFARGRLSTPIRFSGAREYRNVQEFLAAQRAAQRQYELIRRSTEDVSTIARNTGLREFQVARIKDHIFNRTHRLDDGIRRFDPDPDIADAWRRLEAGTHTPGDLRLPWHELFESKFEGIFKTEYRKAHEAANRAGRRSGLE